jgi:hypothetical protein
MSGFRGKADIEAFRAYDRNEQNLGKFAVLLASAGNTQPAKTMTRPQLIML